MVSTYSDTVFGCSDPRFLPMRDQSEDRISVGIFVRIIVRLVSIFAYVEQDWTQKHCRCNSCTCIACTTLSLYSLKAFTTAEVAEECSSLYLYFVPLGLMCFRCMNWKLQRCTGLVEYWVRYLQILDFSTEYIVYEKSAAVLTGNTVSTDVKMDVCVIGLVDSFG